MSAGPRVPLVLRVDGRQENAHCRDSHPASQPPGRAELHPLAHARGYERARASARQRQWHCPLAAGARDHDFICVIVPTCRAHGSQGAVAQM
jgi:hypothetical protein